MRSRVSLLKTEGLIFFLLFLGTLCFSFGENLEAEPNQNDITSTENGDDEFLPDLEPEEPIPEWPTSLHFSTNPLDWPGNGQPLGQGAPTSGIDKVKAFPPRKTFIDDYIIPIVPLQIIDPLKGTNFEKNWARDTFYTSNAFAALIRVNVTSAVAGKIEISLREFFLRKSWDKTIDLETSIPDYLRLDFPVPVSIQCKPIIEELQEGKLRNILSPKSRTIFSRDLDRLICAARGRKNVSLVDSVQMHRDSNFSVSLPDDLSEIDFQAVDFAKFPALRFAKFINTEIRPTDCLYVPAKWLLFQSTSENYVEVEINWNRKRIDSSDKTCGESSTTTVTLGLLKMQKEPEIDLNAIINVAPLQHFFNGVGQKNFTFEQMEQWLKNDKRVLQKMTEWNDEYSEIAGELFLLLDLNRDAVFSANDLDFLTPEKQALFLGRLHDRMQDFNDIMSDQQADQKPTKSAAAGLTPELKAHLEKYNQEMKKLIADAVAQKKEQNGSEANGSEKKPMESSTPDERSRKPTKPRQVNPDRDAEIAESSTDGEIGYKRSEEPEEILAEEDDDLPVKREPSNRAAETTDSNKDLPGQQKDEL